MKGAVNIEYANIGNGNIENGGIKIKIKNGNGKKCLSKYLKPVVENLQNTSIPVDGDLQKYRKFGYFLKCLIFVC